MLWLENKHLVIVGAYSFAWPMEACCGHFATIPKRPIRRTPKIFIQVSFTSIGRLHLHIELFSTWYKLRSLNIERRRPNIST